MTRLVAHTKPNTLRMQALLAFYLGLEPPPEAFWQFIKIEIDAMHRDPQLCDELEQPFWQEQLKNWIRKYPGTRPPGWWAYALFTPRSQWVSEAEFLYRVGGVLTKHELKVIPKAVLTGKAAPPQAPKTRPINVIDLHPQNKTGEPNEH